MDELTEAVLAREEVARYLSGSHGLTGDAARERVITYLDELRTTQRYELYRALEYPLYPILRKIERVGENVGAAVDAAKRHRIVYASNHRSHTDYLVEPLVLDDAGIRPPIIAAGINLFGGPLGLIHKHVTGALPIRRNTKDPAYLITLKAYVGELLRKHDLFFYPEGGRSYSGELKSPKTGPVQRVPARRRAQPRVPADGDRLRPRARGSHPGAPEDQAPAAAVQPRTRRDGALRRRLSQPRVRHVRPADSGRRLRSLVARVGARAGAPGAHGDRPALQGAADGAGRRGDAAVDRAARSHRRASTRCSTRCGPLGANLGVTSGEEAVEAAAEPFEARGIIVIEDGRFRVRERNVLRYYARSIEHLLSPDGPTH